MTNDITKKLRVECMTILDDKEIKGQAIISEVNEILTSISQSDILANGNYMSKYDEMREFVKTCAKKRYGENIKINYSNLNEVKE